MYNFDKEVNRKNTGSIKWDYSGPSSYDGQVIPMGIADMDFEIAPSIKEAMKKRLDMGVFGYEARPAEYNKAIIDWFKRRHNFEIDSEYICFSSDVVNAVGTAIDTISDVGDSIIVQSPVYHAFYRTINGRNRKVVTNPLINNNGYYTMDYDHLDKIITKETKAIILCNPHNPVGRVWTKEELLMLGKICLKHDIWIISDEIHCDIIFDGFKHTVMASLSEEISQKTIMCTAPSKAFSLAGLKMANTIIKNDDIRNKFKKTTVIPICNSFVAPALICAYNESEKWLDEVIVYINRNIDYFVDYVNTNIPKLRVVKPEGTYLVWLDCSRLNMGADELKSFFYDKCGVIPDQGIVFGEEGKNYQRLNLACRRSLVEEAAKRIGKAVNVIK